MTTFYTKLIIDFGHHYGISGKSNLDKTQRKKKQEITCNLKLSPVFADVPDCANRLSNVKAKSSSPMSVQSSTKRTCCHGTEVGLMLRCVSMSLCCSSSVRLGKGGSAAAVTLIIHSSVTFEGGGGAFPLTGSFHSITSFHVLSLNMTQPVFPHGSVRSTGFLKSSVLSSPLDCFDFILGRLHCRLLILYLRHTGLMIHGAALFLFFVLFFCFFQ